MAGMWWQLCVVWSCVCAGAAGGRVLVLFPGAAGRGAPGAALVRSLLAAGHEVTYASGRSSLPAHARLSIVDISSTEDSYSEKERGSVLERVRSPRSTQHALQAGAALARRALQHGGMQRLLADRTQEFDLVLAEWLYSGLLAPLAYVYDCPLVWYSSADASWLSLALVGELVLSAGPYARGSPLPLGVTERAARLWSQAYLTGWAYYMTHYVEAPLYQELYAEALALRGLPPPEYASLVHNASLLLVNSQPLLGQALSLPNNAKYVGGHHIDIPTKPLPQGLQNLLDRSRQGVILFTLGSNVRAKHLGQRMQRKLLDLLGDLQHTVIWELDETLLGTPKNVHVMKRVSRTSVLNHTNTVLLITHGGWLTFMEAMYFGVPLVGIPLAGDQFLTMDLAEARGRGIRVDFSEYLPYKIYDAIHKVLGNSSFGSNARKASAILQHGAAPAPELLRSVELVLLHGGAHLRGAAHQLSTFQKLHLDILTLLLLFVWFCSKVLKVIKVHWNSTDEDDDVKKYQ